MDTLTHTVDIRTLPLGNIPNSTRQLIGDLLNPEIVIPVKEERDAIPQTTRNQLYRDWRGLLTLAELPPEKENCVISSDDKTSEILKLWVLKFTHCITVGNLFEALQAMDRFDVIDDVSTDLKRFIQETAGHQDNEIGEGVQTGGWRRLTVHDTRTSEQYYDLLILYADSDAEVYQHLRKFLVEAGCKVCSLAALAPELPSRRAAAVQLMKRCRRVVTLYSPAFFADRLLVHLAEQAHDLDVETGVTRSLPVVYQACARPEPLARLAALHYRSAYDTSPAAFWERLARDLHLYSGPQGRRQFHFKCGEASLPLDPPGAAPAAGWHTAPLAAPARVPVWREYFINPIKKRITIGNKKNKTVSIS